MEVGEWVYVSHARLQRHKHLIQCTCMSVRLNFINAQRTCARGVITVLIRCVSVCVCVSPIFQLHRMFIQHYEHGYRLHAIFARFLTQGFWLTDFSGKASFESSNSFAGFLHVQHTVAILSTCWRPFTVYVWRMCKVMHRVSHITLNTVSANFDMVLWFHVICSPFASPIFNVLLTSNSLMVW